VPYFRRYTIFDERLSNDLPSAVDVDPLRSQAIPVKRLIDECDPVNDEIDKRIFFEVTGLRLDDSDFKDESPDEDHCDSGGDSKRGDSGGGGGP